MIYGFCYVSADNRTVITTGEGADGRPFVRVTRVVFVPRDAVQVKDYVAPVGYGPVGNVRWQTAVFSKLMRLEELGEQRNEEEDAFKSGFDEDSWIMAYRDVEAAIDQLLWLGH